MLLETEHSNEIPKANLNLNSVSTNPTGVFCPAWQLEFENELVL